MKDAIPSGLRSRVDYKFVCAGCNTFWVVEISQHFFTCVREHLATDRASHIFKHLQQSVDCRTSRSSKCFGILDHATANFQLKIEESLHIH